MVQPRQTWSEFFFKQVRFIFPGNQYVALGALAKGDGGGASAGVEHCHVCVQLGDKLFGFTVDISVTAVLDRKSVV